MNISETGNRTNSNVVLKNSSNLNVFRVHSLCVNLCHEIFFFVTRTKLENSKIRGIKK